jgi:2-hydroxychromene-2-carboxylate isomerase
VTLAYGLDARLSVVLDLRHPLACLALRPTIDFARSMACDVDWLPLSVPPLRPPSAAGPGDDRGTLHRRYRAEALAREIQTYAEAQGLVIREPHRTGDVVLAHLAWLWVRERDPARLPPFLTGLFRSYWALELDASSREAVASQVEAAGADGAAFLAWAGGEGPSVAARVQAELRERGLFQVPAYLLEGEVFYGRQHLPMLRWILEGRSGPPPT